VSLHLVSANALFLHIPKTGGSWVEAALKRCGIETAYAPAAPGVTWRHHLMSDMTRSYARTFAFVRHPISWYESWWKFQAKHWHRFEEGVWHPQRVLEACADDDFNGFIRRCLEREPGYVSRMYEWYLGPPGRSFVEMIGRYERLADDLVAVLRSLGYVFSETTLREQPPENVSPKECGEPIWDEGLRRRILESEAPALRRFYDED
jgi:hypothetical protein